MGSRVECGNIVFWFIRTGQVIKGQGCYLEVQIQNFGMGVKVFIFKIIFFVKIDKKLHFTLMIKEQTQIKKFEIWFLETNILDPRKSAFLFLKKNHTQNCSLLWFSFLNNKPTNVLLVGIFLNTLKKLLSVTKRHFGHFSKLIAFFSSFS